MRVVYDTSIFIGLEVGRLTGQAVPSDGVVSTATVEELWLGVLNSNPGHRHVREATFANVTALFDVVPVTRRIAQISADIRAEGSVRGRRLGLADSLIAATGRHLGLPVYTQDAGFEGMAGVDVHVV